MASRIWVRAASSARALVAKPRPLFSYQWRCLSATPLWRRQVPCTANLASHKSMSFAGWQSVRGLASGNLTVAELEERAQEVLRLFDKVDPEKVTLEAHFIEDLGLDSLDAVEVVMAFEDEFAVEISDEEAEKILSAKDAVEFLKKALDVH